MGKVGKAMTSSLGIVGGVAGTVLTGGLGAGTLIGAGLGGLLGGSRSSGGGDGSAMLAQMNQQEADRLRMIREQNERMAALEAERRKIAQGSYLAGYQDSTAMSQRTLLGVSS